MKPTDHCSALPAGRVLACDVLAHASVQLTADQFPALRKRPGPGRGESLPANFLKHADEQTVAAVAAVLQAIHHSRLTATRLTDWGVVAAPCFLGRSLLVTALQRFAVEGAWGFSPHIIPHRSQHAVAGTLSQALKIHGPNFGTGGGPGNVTEALLAGAVLLEGDRLPAVWVVVTGWEPELIPSPNGRPVTETACHAVALALGRARPECQGLRLRLAPGTNSGGGSSWPYRTEPTVPALAELLADLAEADTPSARVLWRLHGGGWIELGRVGDAVCLHPAEALRRPAAGRSGAQVPPGGAGTENQR